MTEGTTSSGLHPETEALLKSWGLSPEKLKQFADGLNSEVNSPSPPSLDDFLGELLGAVLPEGKLLTTLRVRLEIQLTLRHPGQAQREPGSMVPFPTVDSGSSRCSGRNDDYLEQRFGNFQTAF